MSMFLRPNKKKSEKSTFVKAEYVLKFVCAKFGLNVQASHNLAFLF